MIKHRLILSCCFLVSVLTSAGERVALWPEGKIPDFQAHQIAATTKEAGAPGFKAAEHTMPHLDWYEPPAKKNGACMLLISGGGYHNCCDGAWIDQVAEKFTDLGFVVREPDLPHAAPQGLADLPERVGGRTARRPPGVRKDAAKRGFDPEKLGAFGFSAGGHLTVLLATSSLTPAYKPVDELDQLPCHVNWAVPIYTGLRAHRRTHRSQHARWRCHRCETHRRVQVRCQDLSRWPSSMAGPMSILRMAQRRFTVSFAG